MLFVGWLLIGSGVTLMYASVRNLSVTCLVKSTISGDTVTDCTNRANDNAPVDTAKLPEWAKPALGITPKPPTPVPDWAPDWAK